MQLYTKSHPYTPEEYLAVKEKAAYKSEYRDGEIVPMTGGTTNHNEIALNFAAYLKKLLTLSIEARRHRCGSGFFHESDRPIQ